MWSLLVSILKQLYFFEKKKKFLVKYDDEEMFTSH